MGRTAHYYDFNHSSCWRGRLGIPARGAQGRQLGSPGAGAAPGKHQDSLVTAAGSQALMLRGTPRWQAAMFPDAPRLSKPWAVFSQRVAGFVPLARGCRLELCPFIMHTLPFPHCPGILLLKGHGKEERCGLRDRGTESPKPSAVTSHRAVSGGIGRSGNLALSAREYRPPSRCGGRRLQTLPTVYPVILSTVALALRAENS